MNNKKISRVLFIIILFVFFHNNSFGQAGYVIFGSPSPTGCSESGICQVGATPFSTLTNSTTNTTSPATYVFFTSIYNGDGTYTITMAINLDQLQINQSDQYGIFTVPPNPAPAPVPVPTNYQILNDVYIPTNVIGGDVNVDYPNSFLHIPLNTILPFTQALRTDHSITLDLSLATIGEEEIVPASHDTSSTIHHTPLIPTKTPQSFDILFNGYTSKYNNYKSKVTFSKGSNKHEGLRNRHHKRRNRVGRK